MNDDTDTKNQPNSYRLEDQVGYLLRQASQRHTSIFAENTVDELTPTQFSALIRLSEQGKCSQNLLGRLASMDVATIKGVTDRLRQKGLTKTETDPSDGRRLLISLSEKGEELVNQMIPIGKEISRATLDPLSRAEQEMLIELLKKIC